MPKVKAPEPRRRPYYVPLMTWQSEDFRDVVISSAATGWVGAIAIAAVIGLMIKFF